MHGAVVQRGSELCCDLLDRCGASVDADARDALEIRERDLLVSRIHARARVGENGDLVPCSRAAIAVCATHISVAMPASRILSTARSPSRIASGVQSKAE